MKLDPNAQASDMTKREEIAAMAMQGLLSRHDYTNLADAAEDAVRCADYLIDALNAKEET